MPARGGAGWEWHSSGGLGPRPEAHRVWEGGGHIRASQAPCIPSTACERGEWAGCPKTRILASCRTALFQLLSVRSLYALKRD